MFGLVLRPERIGMKDSLTHTHSTTVSGINGENASLMPVDKSLHDLTPIAPRRHERNFKIALWTNETIVF